MKRATFVLSVVFVSAWLITSCDILNPNAPEACFVAPEEIIAGVPATFSSSCSVNASSFSWDFGDGGTSEEANPVYTYQEAGTYTVTLTVTNAEGDSDQASASIIVAMPSLIEHSGDIDEDETWIEGTHLVTADVYVNGAILTIEPGALIMFSAGRGLYIGYGSGTSGATLLANGTAAKPITFTSAATTKSPGDWDYIGFYEGASSVSSMQHCVVEYGGGYSENYGEIYIDGSSVSIDNSTIRYSEAMGIALTNDGWFESFTGNTLTDHDLYPIGIYGNYAHTIGTGNTITTEKGILVKADDIEQENVTWLEQTCAYVIGGDLYVGSATGAQLTLNPGVELRMGNGTGIYIGYGSNEFGTLVAEGTESDHIRFTTSAPDISKSPGDWDYIGFYEGAGSNSSMTYCDFSYGGGYSENYGMINVDGSSISITNSTLTFSESQGIALRNDASFVSCTGNTFGDNGSVPIEIYGNYAHTIGTGNTFNTGPGILVRSDDMEQTDVTWLKQNIPYLIEGAIYIGSPTGARLTIEAGTTIEFTESSDISVGYGSGNFGVLVADGEPASRITFTSGAAAGFETPGDWDGIWFYDGTGNGTMLDYCLVSYGGGYSNNSGNLNIKNETAGVPVISNCEISYSEAYGIYLDNTADPTLTDNTYGNNALGPSNRVN